MHPAPMRAEPSNPAGLGPVLRLLAVCAAWLGAVRYLPDLGLRVLPAGLLRHLTFTTYSILMQFVTLGVGVALCLLLVPQSGRALGLTRPRALGLGAAILAAPVVFVVASYVAIGIALPTLLEELAKRGPGVSKQNAGEFGRSLQQAPLLVTMLWGTLFAAVAEETLFRGALWSLFDRLVRRFATRARGSDPSFDFIEEPFVVRAARYLCNGWVATLASAAVFGAMHLGMPGAVGIVRVVSTSCLGLALGLARQWGGALAVPILLHLVYNTISLGTTRGWFVGSSLRTYYGVPTLVSLAAGVALVALVGVALVRRLARRPAVAPAAGAEP